MSHQITTLPVGERYRVGLHADVDAESPRTLGDPATGAYTHLRDSRAIDVDTGRDDLAVGRAFEYFDERTAYTGQRIPAAATHVARWARIFHGVTVVDDGGTLWWVDPTWMADAYPDAVLGSDEYRKLEAEVIAADQAEYRKWADGNVYGLTIERRVDWARIDENGEMVFLTEPNTMTTWDVVDSLWGIYFDDAFPSDEDVLKYAAESIGDDDFRTAISALNESNGDPA